MCFAFDFDKYLLSDVHVQMFCYTFFSRCNITSKNHSITVFYVFHETSVFFYCLNKNLLGNGYLAKNVRNIFLKDNEYMDGNTLMINIGS